MVSNPTTLINPFKRKNVAFRVRIFLSFVEPWRTIYIHALSKCKVNLEYASSQTVLEAHLSHSTAASWARHHVLLKVPSGFTVGFICLVSSGEPLETKRHVAE